MSSSAAATSDPGIRASISLCPMRSSWTRPISAPPWAEKLNPPVTSSPLADTRIWERSRSSPALMRRSTSPPVTRYGLVDTLSILSSELPNTSDASAFEPKPPSREQALSNPRAAMVKRAMAHAGKARDLFTVVLLSGTGQSSRNGSVFGPRLPLVAHTPRRYEPNPHRTPARPEQPPTGKAPGGSPRGCLRRRQTQRFRPGAPRSG